MLALAAAILASGCKKSASPEVAKSAEAAAPKKDPVETVARIQWMGKAAIASDTNSAGLMPIWNHPDTVNLEKQTLDKLSVAPWLLLKGGSDSNAPSGLLRETLADALNCQGYLEVRNAGINPGDMVLAVKTGPSRAEVWRTNMALVVEHLASTHVEAKTNGWVLLQHDFPNRIELNTVGDWTVVCLGNTNSALCTEIVERIHSANSPSTNVLSNTWVEANCDLRRLSSALRLGMQVPGTWPRISVSARGDGENVRTRAYADFDQPLALKLEPWVVPQTIVREPLISFTAIQGTRSVLQTVLSLAGLELDPVPNQVYAWALLGLPFQQFFAAPVDNAPATIQGWSTNLLPWANRQIPADVGQITLTNSSLVWTGFIAFTPPRIEPVIDKSNHFALLTLFPIPPSKPAPIELLGQVLNRTNLLYYDWELTSEKLTQIRFLHDSRYVFFDPVHKPRLDNDTATARWFQNCLTNVGDTGTEITLVNSNRLQFARRSRIGFTALELHLLENWLESSRFPEPNISPKLRNAK